MNEEKRCEIERLAANAHDKRVRYENIGIMYTCEQVKFYAVEYALARREMIEANRALEDAQFAGGLRMDVAGRLRRYKRDRSDYAEYCYQAADEIDRLRQVARNVYEVWAGSDGIPMPETAAEAYLLHLVEQMRDEAKNGLHNA